MSPHSTGKSYIAFKLVEELLDGHVANEMTIGEAIVRGILSASNYVTTVYQYQKDRMRVDNLRLLLSEPEKLSKKTKRTTKGVIGVLCQNFSMM